MVACEKAAKRGCNSIMYTGSQYIIYQARRMLSPSPGMISYVLSGTTLKSDGYLWAMKKGWTLTGYDDDTAYKTLKDATKACVASLTCKGVTKEERYYRTNNHNMASIRKGRVAYILGDEYLLQQSKFLCRLIQNRNKENKDRFNCSNGYCVFPCRKKLKLDQIIITNFPRCLLLQEGRLHLGAIRQVHNRQVYGCHKGVQEEQGMQRSDIQYNYSEVPNICPTKPDTFHN